MSTRRYSQLRRLFHCGSMVCLFSALLIGANDGVIRTGMSASAADAKKSHKESHSDRAERLRRQADARAESRLGHERVGHPDDPGNTTSGLEDVGGLISRLGATIQRLEAERRAAATRLPTIPGLPAGGGRKDHLTTTYGPNGPTVKSVKTLLSYRLVTLGNPNLVVGKVVDGGDHVFATITTRDKSLVAEYVIDKKSGRWRQKTSAR